MLWNAFIFYKLFVGLLGLVVIITSVHTGGKREIPAIAKGYFHSWRRRETGSL